MRKIFTFLFAALLSVGMWAEPIEVVWNNYDITGSGNSFTKDGVTVTCGGIDWDNPDFYNGGTFTTDLGNFTHIYVYASDIDMSGNGWSGTTHQQTWTGNAASVSFEGGMHSISDIWFYIEPASTPEPEPEPAGTVVTWDNDFCSNVIACFDSWEWQHVEANNTKDGITVTYSNSEDYGWKVGTIDLYVQENILTFTSTVGDISKIEVYYSANYGSTPNGWTLDATNKKFVWEGTAAAAVDMVGGYVYFIVDYIVFTIGSQGGETAVENVQTNHVQATKFFRDGMLLIEKNGKIYNVMGAEVK